VAFVAVSILSSLASVARVARIDPAKVIGGDFQ
jgi:putative ABC transport system permease protein